MNKNLPAFSFIIPVYNGENVIKNCIQSILNQSHQAYEVIIIDDGSIDQTQYICQRYCDVDTRIKYYKQHNKGVSAARNNGLRTAENEYILFIDADDYLLPDFLQRFNELITNRNLENKTLVVQDFIAKIKSAQNKVESYNWCKFSSAEYAVPEMFEELKFMNWLNWGVPFAKLYCLSIIKSYNISFDERMSFREDLVFMLDYLNHVENIIFDSNANYCYTIDNTKKSLSNTTASLNNEIIFFEYLKSVSDACSNKFQLSEEAKAVLQRVVYTSFLRCVNSCIYKHKIPITRKERILGLRSLSTEENMRQLSVSGVVDTKVKHFAFFLLKNKLFNTYDLLNKIRYNLA